VEKLVEIWIQVQLDGEKGARAQFNEIAYRLNKSSRKSGQELL
jgi:hypothetical protein